MKHTPPESQNIGVAFTLNLFLRLKSILPPIIEQDEIADHIEQTIAKHDIVINRLQQQVARLQDMKIRLISDVVTGRSTCRALKFLIMSVQKNSLSPTTRKRNRRILLMKKNKAPKWWLLAIVATPLVLMLCLHIALHSGSISGSTSMCPALAPQTGSSLRGAIWEAP